MSLSVIGMMATSDRVILKYVLKLQIHYFSLSLFTRKVSPLMIREGGGGGVTHFVTAKFDQNAKN